MRGSDKLSGRNVTVQCRELRDNEILTRLLNCCGLIQFSVSCKPLQSAPIKGAPLRIQAWEIFEVFFGDSQFRGKLLIVDYTTVIGVSYVHEKQVRWLMPRGGLALPV